MASSYLGINKGQSDNNPGLLAISASATNSTDIELRWDMTKSLTKKDILNALELFEVYIEANGVCGNASGVAAGTGLPPL